MHSQEEIVQKAAHLKVALVNRAQRLQDLAAKIGKARAGIIRMKADVIDTMEGDFVKLSESQERDGKYFATLRWVLGCTEDIDPDNLQLEA